MQKSAYAKVGSTYLVGIVCDYKYSKKEGKYIIRWVSSYFNNQMEMIDLKTLKEGRANYDRLQVSNDEPRWTLLIRLIEKAKTPILEIAKDLDDLSERQFAVQQTVPHTLEDVERIMEVEFDQYVYKAAPKGLYQHSDGSTKTRLKQRSRHLFEHSASSCFFAYLPQYFWRQVLDQTNAQPRLLPDSDEDESTGASRRKRNPFTMDELMRFLGILWYMSLIGKGEYANYCGEQLEDGIFHTGSTQLDTVMPL
jgi:hypothetical protein